MSGRITIDPDRMNKLASVLDRHDSEHRNLAEMLGYNYGIMRSIYPEIDSTYSGSLFHSLTQKLNQYSSLVHEASAIVKKTEVNFRMADEGLGDIGNLDIEIMDKFGLTHNVKLSDVGKDKATGEPLELPTTKDGHLLQAGRGKTTHMPDPAAEGRPHTQLGWTEGRRGPYRQTLEWDSNGEPVHRIDWTDHGRRHDHVNPHVHDRQLIDGSWSFKKKGRPLE